jgi:heptosyltransferase-2
MSEPGTIAVFVPNWVGDVVMATPALRAIRAHFTNSRIVALLRPYVAGVLEARSWFDARIFFDPRGTREQRWLSVVRRLRRERVELAILFPNSFRSAFVAWLACCHRRIGYARYGRSFLLTDTLIPLRFPHPVIDAYNRLAERVGCSPPGHRMELATTATDEEQVDDLWQASFGAKREIVCLNPGGAFGSAKHWPSEYFARLAQMFADRRGSGVLILCAPADKERARQIVAQSGRRDVHSLANHNPSLGLTKACVRRADLLVTTDSGPRHFAAAFDRPVVSLFGPTHVAWTRTYHPKEVCLQKKVPCGPCQLRTCPLDHQCMKQLTPDEVFEAAEQLLKRTGRVTVAG